MFDWFIIGPENISLGNSEDAGWSGQPSLTRGDLGRAGRRSDTFVLDGAEYGRLAPGKNVALGLGTELLQTHAAGDLSVLAQADLLLLDEVDGLRAGTARAWSACCANEPRPAASPCWLFRLGRELACSFCSKEFPRGLSVDLLPQRRHAA